MESHYLSKAILFSIIGYFSLVSASFATCRAVVTYEIPRWNELPLKRVRNFTLSDNQKMTIRTKEVTKIENVGNSKFLVNYGGLWADGFFSKTASIHSNQRMFFHNVTVHTLECTDAIIVN